MPIGDLVRYRKRAKQARETAAKATSSDMRESWLHIADSYEKLAEAAEKNEFGVTLLKPR